MPVHVDVPTRIRVDARAMQAREECIQEALGAAAQRALRNSQQVVIEDRGGFLMPRLYEPEFVWSGAGLAAVPPPWRERFEARVRATLADAAREAGILQWRRRTQRVPSPMPDRVFERLDPARYSSLLGRYLVPSYDDPEGSADVPVGTVTVEIVDVQEMAAWRVIGDQNWWADTRFFESALSIAQSAFGSLPSTPPWGVLWRTPNGWGILIQKPGDAFYFYPHRFAQLEKVGTPSHETVGLITKVPTPNRGTARYLTRAQILDVLRSNIEGVLRRQTVRRGMTRSADVESTIAERAEDVLAQLAPGPEVVCAIHVTVGDVGTLFYLETDYPFSGVAPIVPIVELVVPSEEGERAEEGGGGDGGEGATRTGTGRGAGTGAGGGDGTGAGDGSGAGAGTGAGRGGVVFTGAFGADEAATRGSLFPSMPAEDGVALRCTPFDHEPPVTAMGDVGAQLWRQILEIKNDLDMEGCIFPGRFCLHAATMLQSRAADVGDFAAMSTPAAQRFIRPIKIEPGAVGLFEFVPTDPPAMQLMAHLARVTSRIGDLSRALDRALERPEIAAKFESPAAFWWRGYFAREFRPLMRKSVAILFAMACRVYLLQLLDSSRQAILQRQQHLDAYTAVFEQLLQVLITAVDQLQDLRAQLDAVQPRGVFEQIGRGAYSSWRGARSALTEAFEPPVVGARGGTPGQIVYEGEQAIGIRDAEGRMWTRAALESALALKQNSAATIDPLVNQILEDPGLRRRFTATGADVRFEVERLLEEMKQKNEDITKEARADWEYAFKASSIHRDYRQATIPGGAYALTGIHAQVHERIGEFFRSEPFYASGVDLLLGVESGRQSLLAWLEFGVIVALAVFCAPAAFLVGIGTAIYHHQQALEKASLFRALIDPEQVLSRAEVEAELFATELGLALSFIPEVGTILKTGTAAVKSFARAGTRGGARLLVRYVRNRITRQMVRELQRGVVKGFAHEIAEDQVEDFILNKVLFEPALDQIYREFQLTEAAAGLTTAGAAASSRDVAESRAIVEEALGEGEE